MFICVFTGFSSGLPLFVLWTTVPTWLRSEHVDLTSIGIFSLLQFPYLLKFLWAPFLDRYSPPGFGRRRGWMIVTQIGLLLLIPMFGSLNPLNELRAIAGLAIVIAIFSATQDAVLDAYRRELLDDTEFPLGTSIHINAYRIASLVSGALALYLADHMPWDTVFVIVALFMVPGVVMTLLVSEPALNVKLPRTLGETVVEPFREFILRAGWREATLILAFILLYKLGDAMATTLATPFYLDMGFTKTQIAVIAKFVGLWATVAGLLLGGLWMLRLGVNRALWLFGVVQVVSILGFAALAGSPQNEVMLGVAVGFEALGVGLGTIALSAFIGRATNPAFVATQYALFTCVAAIPRVLLSSTTGWIVDHIGWFNFFLLCTALAVPGMLLLIKVAPWSELPVAPKPKKAI